MNFARTPQSSRSPGQTRHHELGANPPNGIDRGATAIEGANLSVPNLYGVPRERRSMAQQATTDDEAQTENYDPELAAATEVQAIDSLQVHMTRDEMREACRAWDLDGYSGTKAEMAQTMVEQAPGNVVATLLEEGVEITGDLADTAGLTTEEDEGDEEAEGDEEDSNGRSRTTLGEMLEQHPDDYHRDNALAFSDKQAEVLAWAMNHAGDTDEQAAEALDCSARYVNSVCHRWPASEEGIEAVQDTDLVAEQGYTIPEQFRETNAPQEDDD